MCTNKLCVFACVHECVSVHMYSVLYTFIACASMPLCECVCLCVPLCKCV